MREKKRKALYVEAARRARAKGYRETNERKKPPLYVTGIKTVCFLDRDLHRRLRVEAARRNISRSELISEALEAFLSRDRG